MKKVLLVSLLAIAGVSVSAQNLIKNEKFATEVTNKVTNPNKATAGEWFIMNNEADGVTTIAWEQTGDAKYPNAMKIDNSGAEKNTSWYKAFLGQRITDGLEKGIYVLTFYAKAKEAGTPVSVYTQIGIILLVALSAKNGILIVEFARDFRAEGNSIREAAYEAGHVRLRPILMTSFAFVLGVMPLLFATGAGAQSRIALGTAVVFGMAMNTLLATVYIPNFYELMQKLQEKFSRKKDDDVKKDTNM